MRRIGVLDVVRRGLAALVAIAGACVVAMAEPSLTGCGGCDFEGQCMAQVGKTDSQRANMCGFAPLENTFNATIITWTSNPGDPMPYGDCACDVAGGPGGTIDKCVFQSSDTCATLTDCASCTENFFCGWCDNACTITYGSNDTSKCDVTCP